MHQVQEINMENAKFIWKNKSDEKKDDTKII